MYENIKFQYYKNDVAFSNAAGFISLSKFLKTIQAPKHNTRELLEQVAKVSNDMKNIADKKSDIYKELNRKKAELKKHLYSFTPDVVVKNKRKYEDIVKYTGLAVLDFDKIDYAQEFKEFLFNEYKSIIAAWLSPSKRGVKAFVKIPIVKTKEEFKAYTWGISAEFEQYKGFDIAVNNAVLLLFIAYDKDILIREDPKTWLTKGVKKNSFDLAKVKTFKLDAPITDLQTEWVVNWFTNGINSIFDNGHPQLRSYCVALGGYVSGGYISLFDAISLAESLITQNNYLQKGISGYQKTARQAIQLGTNKPLIFGA